MTTSNKPSTSDATKLYAHVVLDRSGSMHSCAAEAVSGYNGYVATLPPGARVSLTLFDTEGIDLVRDGVETAAAGLVDGEYAPRGGTPLYDAIGLTIAEAEKRSSGFDRVALVILTDGFENASEKFRRDDILKLLTRKQEQDGWLVVYLGANQDAWAVGESFGAAGLNSLSFDQANVEVALASAGDATNRFLASDNAQIGRRRAAFSADERSRAKK